MSLVSFVSSLTWLDSHWCVTGDCPHQTAQECADTLIDEVKQIAEQAREALRE